MSRIRVLQVVGGLHYGGMERLVAELSARLDPDRFEPHVLGIHSLGHFESELGQRTKAHLAPRMTRLSLLRPRALARQIASIAPDVVHTHSGVWYKTARAARLAGVRCVMYTEHGRTHPDPLIARLMDGLAARQTDLVIAVSEALARRLARGIVPDSRRIRCVVNGVDVARFAPRPDTGRIRQELQIPPDVRIVGSIGRLEPVKGYEVMVEAMHLLNLENAVLLVVGGGSEEARLQTLIARWGLGGKVRLLGWRDDIEELLASFDLFCMSSHSEGTSVSLLEAMSSGLCPLVTDVGGNASVLGLALRHRLVPPARPDLLASALREALDDGQRRAADARAARQRVEEAFSLHAMVRAYERIYEECARTGHVG